MENKKIILIDKKRGRSLDEVFNDIILKIFYFHKTFYSFKSSTNGILYYRDANSSLLKWKEAIYSPEQQTVLDGEIVEMDFKTIFRDHLADVILDETIPYTFSGLANKYKEHLPKYYKKSPLLLITILFYFNLTNGEELLLNEKYLSKDDIIIINELSKLDLIEQNKFIKNLINEKYEDDLLEKLLLDIYGKDIKLLSKVNSFFGGKVTLPGKYLVKHNELILKSLLMAD